MKGTFRALIVDQKEGQTTASIQKLLPQALPAGDVLISVHYSSLNYKDALAVTGRGKVVRRFPMVPGIDLAGVIEQSASPRFKEGDSVILTGWGIGEQHWGGFSELARVKSEWLISLPKGLTLKQAMGIGTAGLTAMFSVMELENHGLNRLLENKSKGSHGGKLSKVSLESGGLASVRASDEREVIVTGATGGVGSIAVAILAKLGYRVAASTGKIEASEYLKSLGASSILARKVLSTPSEKPLESERWGGAVDTVGGDTLAGLLRGMARGSSVTACGLAGGSFLNTTVFPFILRGVNLLGIESAWAPLDHRQKAWERLVNDLPKEILEQIIQEISLDQVPEFSQKMLEGKIQGRIVISLRCNLRKSYIFKKIFDKV